MNAWHDVHDGRWMEFVPPQNPAFAANWLARQKDMVEKYRPDMVYLDDTGLPFGSYGIEALAPYYAQGRDADGGLDVVLTAKQPTDYQRGALVAEDRKGVGEGTGWEERVELGG